MLRRPGFSAWSTPVPQVEDHHRLFQIFAEVPQGLAVARVGPPEQHAWGPELRRHIRPRAVLARPLPHAALQRFVLVVRKNPVRSEPSASQRELRVHRSHSVFVIAPWDEISEGPGHTYGRPGPAICKNLLLLSESLGLTFNKQQVIKQDPKGRLTAEHPRPTECQVQVLDKVGAYLFRGGKGAGRDHLHSLPHRGQAEDPESADWMQQVKSARCERSLRAAKRGCEAAAQRITTRR